MIDLVKKTKIRHLNIKSDKRLIFVSDIHGDLYTFLYGLKEINYTKDDYLFLIGDIIEKGDSGMNLKTFKHIIKMKEEYPNFKR